MDTAGTSSRATTEALVQRLFEATIDTLEVASVHVGSRPGLYRALATEGDGRGMTPGELAGQTGTAERYVREWLEQQAVAGFLSVDRLDAAADERRYSLPPAHRPVLVDEGSLDHVAPLARLSDRRPAAHGRAAGRLSQRRGRGLRGLRRRHPRRD